MGRSYLQDKKAYGRAITEKFTGPFLSSCKFSCDQRNEVSPHDTPAHSDQRVSHPALPGDTQRSSDHRKIYRTQCF